MVSAPGALHAGDECGVHVQLFAAASDQEPAAVGPYSAARVERTGALDLGARSLAFRPDLLGASVRGYGRASRKDQDRRGRRENKKTPHAAAYYFFGFLFFFDCLKAAG